MIRAMRIVNIRSILNCFLILLCSVLAPTISAQTKPEKPGQQDDVVRVNTELVQTDVMVFDKKDRFVDGLKPEQFALRVDNKPQTIAFFEHVTSESLREERKTQVNAGAVSISPSAAIRGRTVIFSIDDLHLAPDSLRLCSLLCD